MFEREGFGRSVFHIYNRTGVTLWVFTRALIGAHTAVNVSGGGTDLQAPLNRQERHDCQGC